MVNQNIGSAIQQRVFDLKIGVASSYLYAPTSCQSRNKIYSENLSIKTPLTPAIRVQVTNEELEELFYILEKFKINKETPTFEKLTLRLIGKKLVVRCGNIIHLTNHGKNVIRLAITGDLVI